MAKLINRLARRSRFPEIRDQLFSWGLYLDQLAEFFDSISMGCPRGQRPTLRSPRRPRPTGSARFNQQRRSDREENPETRSESCNGEGGGMGRRRIPDTGDHNYEAQYGFDSRVCSARDGMGG
jgi:hypothetical protein